MKPEDMLLEQIRQVSDSFTFLWQNKNLNDEIRRLNDWDYSNRRRNDDDEDEWWASPIIGVNREVELDDFTDYSVLAEIQAIEPFLAGYTSQLMKKKTIRDVQQAARGIRNYRLFQLKHFVSWYLAHSGEYPHLREYTQKLDYWRLLLLQYVDLYLLEESG